jgi:hypothetical protein
MYGRPALKVGGEFRMPVDHLVEPHAIGLIRFRQQDDLAGVHREVLDDVIDGLEDRHVARLNRAPSVQVRWRE